MSKIFSVCSLFFLLTTTTICSGQFDLDSISPKKSYFKASLNYLSNNVFNGRADSVAMPYITPSIGYYNKSGFFTTLSASYLANSSSRIDLFSFDIGYDATISKTVGAGVYVNKSFYNQQSSVVQSSIPAFIGGYLSYDASFITLYGGLDIALGDDKDVFSNLSASHSFYIGDAAEFSISPAVTANFGSQNFYQGYFTNKPVRQGLQQRRQVQIKNTKKFSLLSYEINIPLAYDATKWGVSLSPTYAIPQSPSTYTTNNGVTFATEKLNNIFFVEAGVYIKF